MTIDELKAELSRLIAKTPPAHKIDTIQKAVGFKETHDKAVKAHKAARPTIGKLQSAIAELRLYVG